MTSQRIRQLIAGMALCIVFYAALAAYEDLSRVGAAFIALGWSGWGLILGLSLFNYLLRFIRWHYYLRQLNQSVPAGPNLVIYLAGFGFTTTPGKVGEALRSVYLKRWGVEYSASLAAFFVERLVDLLAMIVIAALALYAFKDMQWLLVVTLALTLAFLWLVHSTRLPILIRRWSALMHSPRIEVGVNYLLQMLERSAPLLKSTPLQVGFGLGLLAWAAEGVALYVVVQMLGTDIDVLLTIGIYGVSILAGVVTFVPGGLGGTELLMQFLLKNAGMVAALAVSAVIICRVATLWFAVAIGLACVAWLEIKVGHSSMPAEQLPGKRSSGQEYE